MQQIDDHTRQKQGFEKIRFVCEQSVRDNLEWTWVDTCCIDKTDNAELAVAINPMFRWYRSSDRCWPSYLSDVSARKRKQSEGFVRTSFGSRLSARADGSLEAGRFSELLAPRLVYFFAQDGTLLGDKIFLLSRIHEITRIAIPALRGDPLPGFDVEERFKWAENRETALEEDWAYSLQGIFSVFIVPIYGEGKAYAVGRLRREINAVHGKDQERLSILDWLTPVDYTSTAEATISIGDRRGRGSGF